MSDYPETPTTPGGRSHKSRPSLVTNASGFAESTMSCGSMTTADGLSRLSHFPLPPIGVPLSPFEAQLDWPTPVRRASEMTPPDTPKADPILPHSGSSIISPSGMTGPSLLPMSPPVTPPIRPRRNLPTPPPSVGSPISVRPLVIGSTFVSDSSQISPHDWHDGSSSLAMNGYEERLLPTNLITSLLSTVTPEDDITPDQPPPRYKRDPYEPSVVSGIANRDSIYPPSSIVALQSPPYTPRHDYPPPHLRNISVSDASSAKSSTILSGPVGSSSMVPVIPTQDGRVTPESSRTYGSEVTELSRTAVRTATYAPAVSRDAAVVGVAHATTRSVAPSLGSMNSTTPLMQSVPRGDVIHEDTIGEQLGAAGPSTPTTAHRESQRFRETRSIRSTKTSKSYVPSLVTRFSHSTVGERRSFKQAVTWFRKKPLPPVPRLPDFSVHQEIEHRRAEATLPLPDLVHRAQALSQMLDKGDPPHHSPIEGNNKFEELYLPSGSAPSSPPNFSANHPGLMSRARKAYSQDYRDGEWNQVPPAVPNKPRKFLVTRRQKICCGGIVLAIVIIVIAVAVGVSVGKKHSSSSSCAANLAGAKCDLDATCVCIQTNGQCNNLAQVLVNLVPTLNSQFNMSFTSATLSTAVWKAQGNPGKTCVSQANAIDVGAGLDANQFPNRTQWAQAALLWNLVQTQNTTDTSKLQKFAINAPWSSLGTSDGPTTQSQTQFTTTASGFVFNFAAQTATPVPATFIVTGQPTQAQIGRVNDIANTTLNRMYTFAQASSTQQFNALSQYWTSTLQQSASNLSKFVSIVSGSPILLPFDATTSAGGQKISSLLTNSTTTPFPPPLACYPGLGVTQLENINAFETAAFALSASSTTSQFNTTCYPDRPIYGVLDILQLRLPFVDSRSGLARQAAILTRDAYTRSVVYSGEVLSAFPANTNMSGIASTMTDPRRFGTLNQLNHVILNYLTSISDINVATALVNFVLSSSSTPPKSGTLLFQSLSSLPALEVAVFGSVLPSDLTKTYSSFATPSGSLFMGTDESVAVRDWTLVALPASFQPSVVWAELATSPEVVRDSSFTDINFNNIFTQAFNFFHFPSNATVNVGNVTAAFQAVQKFTP